MVMVTIVIMMRGWGSEDGDGNDGEDDVRLGMRHIRKCVMCRRSF